MVRKETNYMWGVLLLVAVVGGASLLMLEHKEGKQFQIALKDHIRSHCGEVLGRDYVGCRERARMEFQW